VQPGKNSRPFKTGAYKWDYQSRGVFRLPVATGYLQATYKSAIYQWEIAGFNQYDDLIFDTQLCTTARCTAVALPMIEDMKEALAPL
jgi:hypothetical protein